MNQLFAGETAASAALECAFAPHDRNQHPGGQRHREEMIEQPEQAVEVYAIVPERRGDDRQRSADCQMSSPFARRVIRRLLTY